MLLSSLGLADNAMQQLICTGRHSDMNRCFSLAEADQQVNERGRVSMKGAERRPPPLPRSDEPPHLQLHDPEVVGFREAAVVESVAGAAAAHVQVLVHPQSKVATEWDKDICYQLPSSRFKFSSAAAHQIGTGRWPKQAEINKCFVLETNHIKNILGFTENIH